MNEYQKKYQKEYSKSKRGKKSRTKSWNKWYKNFKKEVKQSKKAMSISVIERNSLIRKDYLKEKNITKLSRKYGLSRQGVYNVLKEFFI